MSAAIQNALTLALLRHGLVDFVTAEAFAKVFVEENAELFGQQLTVRPQQVTRSPGGQTTVTGTVEEPVANPANPANRMTVPVVGPDGLTNAQRDALAKNIPLCPNCQQPTNDHLPGCARASGEDPKARTKAPLPPVQ